MKKNNITNILMQRGFINLAVLIISILIISGVAYFIGRTVAPDIDPVQASNGIEIASVDFSVTQDGVGTVNVAGTANPEMGWTAFEGEIGSVALFNDNDEQLSQDIPVSILGDWMTSDILSFDLDFTFENTDTESVDGYVVFTHSRVSDDDWNPALTYQFNVTDIPSTYVEEVIIHETCQDLVITSPVQDETITSPQLTITGNFDPHRDDNCTWVAFEGVAGSVTVYVTDTMTPLLSAPITLPAGWMTMVANHQPVPFSITIDLGTIPTTGPATLVFTEDGAAGGSLDSFEIPVVLDIQVQTPPTPVS